MIESPLLCLSAVSLWCVTPTPFSFAVLKGLKEEGHGIVMLWGRILLLTWKLHFFFFFLAKSFAF